MGVRDGKVARLTSLPGEVIRINGGVYM